MYLIFITHSLVGGHWLPLWREHQWTWMRKNLWPGMLSALGYSSSCVVGQRGDVLLVFGASSLFDVAVEISAWGFCLCVSFFQSPTGESRIPFWGKQSGLQSFYLEPAAVCGTMRRASVYCVCLLEPLVFQCPLLCDIAIQNYLNLKEVECLMLVLYF